MSTTVATIERPTRSVLVDMSTRYGMEPAAFEATVRATCMKPDKNGRVPSREEFAAFLLVAKEYSLNPLTKEIYAFSAKGGGIVPIVSIDGWVNLVNSHGACDGFEFDMEHDAKGNLVSCTCRMFRKDRSKPVAVTEYLSECIRNTEPWAMKHRMLRHKAMIQAARYAFGFSGIYDEDEGAKIAEMRDVTTRADDGPPPPPARSIEHQPQPAVNTAPIATDESYLSLVEDGRSEPGDVVWEDAPPVGDPLDIPPGLDRRTKPVDAINEAQWLRDFEGALSGCEDMVTVGETQAAMMVPMKARLSKEAWAKAVALVNAAVNRIQREG